MSIRDLSYVLSMQWDIDVVRGKVKVGLVGGLLGI